MESELTLVLASIAVLGMTAQWLAWRLHIPAIVLLTVFGLLAGPVTGWLQPSRDLGALLNPLITLGVAVILFEGGLNLQFQELRQAAAGVRRLVSVGVVIALVLGGLAAHYIGGLSWPVAWVFGAIVVVTGPTVIIPLLRQARLHPRPASYLKWEGIINDPTGALLAVLIFEYFLHTGDGALPGLVVRLGAGLALAVVLGAGGGWLLGVAFRRGWVAEYLKGPMALSAALGAYALSNRVLDESGLLAATIMGVVLGNMRLPSIGEIKRFKEYVAIVLVSSVFVLLTADLNPKMLLDLNGRSLALLLALLFVVRPVTVWLSTLGTDMRRSEKLLVGWIAPRGIVAAAIAGVFAPQLQARGYAGAGLLLPLVFALIMLTVVVHGFSIGVLARRLGLSARRRDGVLIAGASAWGTGLAETLKALAVPVMVADTSWHRLRAPRLAGVPVYYGELMSEVTEHRLEFNEMGYLFAVTDNDAYNALVCTHFAAEVGRHKVFQLPQYAQDEDESKGVARAARGMLSPSRDAQYEELQLYWYRGWRFQKTKLTDVFSYEDGLASLPEGAIPLALVRENDAVLFISPERALKPRAGDVVIWFGAPRESRIEARQEKVRQAAALENGDRRPVEAHADTGVGGRDAPPPYLP